MGKKIDKKDMVYEESIKERESSASAEAGEAVTEELPSSAETKESLTPEEQEELEFWKAYEDLDKIEDQEDAARREAELDAELDDKMDGIIREAFEMLIDEEYANRPQYPKAQFSEEFERRMERMLYDEPEEPKEEKSSRISSLLALFRPVKSRRAVVLVAALMVLLVGMTAGGANPIIIWLHDSWMEQHGDYVEIETREDVEKVSKDISQKYELTEIPNGYKLKNEQFFKEIGIYYITYADEEGKLITFKQGRKDNKNIGNVTADRKDIEEIKVNDLEGYYVKDSDMANLVLSDEEYMLVFIGDLSKEQLIELAEGLQKVE